MAAEVCNGCDDDKDGMRDEQILNAAGTGVCMEWYLRDEFRRLRLHPNSGANVGIFVTQIAHPSTDDQMYDGDYGELPAADEPVFISFANSLLLALDQATDVVGLPPNWCTVRDSADRAGYDLFRFLHNDGAGVTMWLVYAQPRNPDQAHFFFNPAAKRNVIVEVPHVGTEDGTDEQGAAVLLRTAALGMLINGHDRCSAGTTVCTEHTTYVCSGMDETDRASDVAHTFDNTFHVMHVAIARHTPKTNARAARFIQLHGKGGTEVHVGDGSTIRTPTSAGPSVDLSAALEADPQIAAANIINCQRETPTETALCGSENIQGIELARGGGFQDAQNDTDPLCEDTNQQSFRFIHLESSLAFRNNNREDLIAALQGLNAANGFAECDFGLGGTDCAPVTNHQIPAVDPDPLLNCP